MTSSGIASLHPSSRQLGARHPDGAAIDPTRREAEDPLVALFEDVDVGGAATGGHRVEDQPVPGGGAADVDVDRQRARVGDRHPRDDVGIAQRERHPDAQQRADDEQDDDRDGGNGPTGRMGTRHGRLRHGRPLRSSATTDVAHSSDRDGGREAGWAAGSRW